MTQLDFGTFLSPFHPPHHNPTLSLQQDLELIRHLDLLGFDEAWFGEHHSAGGEIIASPEIFIMAAAERTRRIRLGTGVISLPYHNPLWVADRLVLLDHLTHGRAMLGLGPGALPTDAAMIGMQPAEMRPYFHRAVDVLMHLLRSEEPISWSSDRCTLVEARLQLRPYSDPLFDVVIAATASPTGARIAGRHGVGLLSLGATMNVGMDILNQHWSVAEEVAAESGTTVDRSKWRLVGLMHLAETETQARADVQYGIAEWFRYNQHTIAFPQLPLHGSVEDEMIEYVNGGLGVIGTPEQAVDQISRLIEQSNGGFGVYLILAHNWANPEATRRSWELFAREVMPHFRRGGIDSLIRSAADARATRASYADQQLEAVQLAGLDWETERMGQPRPAHQEPAHHGHNGRESPGRSEREPAQPNGIDPSGSDPDGNDPNSNDPNGDDPGGSDAVTTTDATEARPRRRYRSISWG